MIRHLSRRLAFLTVVSVVFALILIYPLVRIGHLIDPARQFPVALGMLVIGLPFAARWLTETVQTGWSRRFAAIVMTYIGGSFVALALLVPGEILLLVTPVGPELVGWSVAVLATTLTVYGIVNAHSLQVRILDLNAPPPVRGRTLVQISDVHVGSRDPGLLRRIVARVNALEPDFVLITGDLVDMRGITQTDLAPLSRIAAPTYFCIGNHERYVDLNPICERLENLGLRVLRNATERAPPLQFSGIDDAESREQVASQLPALVRDPALYQVLLYHRPDGLADAAAWGVDLMLTGHTHRGQIFPFYYLVKRIFPNIYGAYRSSQLTLYVSPGTGTWGPVMRLGSRCEITLIRLL